MSKEFDPSILKKYPEKESSLIEVLQDVQARYRYISREAMKAVSAYLKVPLSRVYSVATFYKAFSLNPRGKYHFMICTGTACHIRGAPQLVDELCRDTGIRPGETSDDLQYTLETVNCVGACAMAPVVILNGKYHGAMDATKARRLIKKGK
jgi:NADH-quinone oxidoreductase subunit E